MKALEELAALNGWDMVDYLSPVQVLIPIRNPTNDALGDYYSGFFRDIYKAAGSMKPFWLLFFLLLSSCNPITGGSCSYKDHHIRCEITKLHLMRDGTCEIYFQPRLEAADISNAHLNDVDQYHPIVIERPSGERIDSSWLRENGINVGKRFSIVVSVIEKGTCTPIQYRKLYLPAKPFL